MTRTGWTLAGILALVVGAEPVAPASQPPAQTAAAPTVLVRRDDRDPRRIVRGDLASGAIDEVYRSNRAAVDDLQVAPNESYVALIETTAGKEEGGEYVVPPVNRLVVLRADGTPVRTVEADVRQYTFSPDGARLAYITGAYYEGGAGFKPDGAFILDIASGRTQRIDGADSAVELNWVTTPAENSLYLKTLDSGEGGATVRRYDVASGRLAATSSKAFSISPDGLYYMVQPHEAIESGMCEPGRGDDSCLRVYERRNERRITFFESKDIGTPVGWVYGQGHSLLFTKHELEKVDQQVQRGDRTVRGRLAPQARDADNAVYDVQSTRVTERFRGVVAAPRQSGWVSSPRTLIVRDAARAQPGTAPALDAVTLRKATPQVTLTAKAIAAARVLPSFTLQAGVNLPGGDYRTIDNARSPEACEAACAGDAKCRAFTFVRPTVRGQATRCLLKASVPAAQPDRRYVSGIKRDR